MTHIRSGVIIIENDKVALIRRVNAKSTYYLFPGGGVEVGETVEEAAIREAWEELGVQVQVSNLVATVQFGPDEQHYYLAHIVSGEFGTGTGEELASPANSPAGTYLPVWLAQNQLHQYDVRPQALAELIMNDAFMGNALPLRIQERVQ